MKKLLCYLFVAKVLIPWGHVTYDNVASWSCEGEQSYKLVLTDSSVVYVPVIFTIIEEIKK